MAVRLSQPNMSGIYATPITRAQTAANALKMQILTEALTLHFYEKDGERWIDALGTVPEPYTREDVIDWTNAQLDLMRNNNSH